RRPRGPDSLLDFQSRPRSCNPLLLARIGVDTRSRHHERDIGFLWGTAEIVRLFRLPLSVTPVLWEISKPVLTDDFAPTQVHRVDRVNRVVVELSLWRRS